MGDAEDRFHKGIKWGWGRRIRISPYLTDTKNGDEPMMRVTYKNGNSSPDLAHTFDHLSSRLYGQPDFADKR